MFSRILLVCILLVYGSAGIYDVLHTYHISREAIIYDGISREILATTTEGRQALVASVYMPPLNTLLRVPFTVFFTNSDFPVSSIIVSLIFGIASILLLDTVLGVLNMGWQRLLFVGAFMLHPGFYSRCINGSSETTSIFFMILILYGCYGWISTRDVKFLVYYATGTGLMALVCFEVLPILFFAVLVIIFNEVFLHGGTKSEKGAVMLLALLPLFYTIGFWLLLNWLIMGDGLYFLRGLFFSLKKEPPVIPYPLELSPYHIGAILLSLVVMFASALTGNRGGIFTGALAISPLPLAIAGASSGLVRQPSVLISYAPFMAIISAGLVCTGHPKQTVPASGRTDFYNCLQFAAGAILFITTSFISLHPEMIKDYTSQKLLSFDDVIAFRNKEVPALVKHVKSVSRYVKVFVCGYDSFILLGGKKDKIFVRSIDFNLNKACQDYYGHVLFVLLKQPDLYSVADSHTWKYPDAFDIGFYGTLYDSDWGEWRLFEVVRSSYRTVQQIQVDSKQ